MPRLLTAKEKLAVKNAGQMYLNTDKTAAQVAKAFGKSASWVYYHFGPKAQHQARVKADKDHKMDAIRRGVPVKPHRKRKAA